MSISKLSGIAIKHALIVLAISCLAGCCLIGGEYLADEPIGSKRADSIKRGETTRQQILAWLGPPIAIARKGRKMIFPGPAVGSIGFVDGPSEAFFELFSSQRTLQEEEVVFYYQASRVTTSGFLMVLLLINGGAQTERVEADQLWLLVNEKTGVVEDYVYRDSGRRVEGRVPSQAPELGIH